MDWCWTFESSVNESISNQQEAIFYNGIVLAFWNTEMVTISFKRKSLQHERQRSCKMCPIRAIFFQSEWHLNKRVNCRAESCNWFNYKMTAHLFLWCPAPKNVPAIWVTFYFTFLLTFFNDQNENRFSNPARRAQRSSVSSILS